MQFSDLPSILLVVFMHVVVDCAAANYFSCTTSAYCAHRNAGSTPMTYGCKFTVKLCRPGHPSASSMATVMCAITYWWIHSQRVLQPSCGGCRSTKPEKVVTVAIYDFDTKFQCREAPNSA
ncbi:hypothetical protein KEM48_010934 [Puccinia striiformis f. sp. tritici PST-130]|nr:hypothetical protein KEM48_010934 [Puccinia striiformis f. sp. tritici PST-130]